MKSKKIPIIAVAPIITLLIMLVLYALGGIFPFGANSTAAYDGIAQYVPFLSELASKIRDGGSLLFSWRVSNGSNFWSIISYYLASPLNLIAVFFPANRMMDAFSIITLLKPVLIALTFSIFLRYSYKRKDLSVAIFSVLWAMSSFMVECMSFTSWFDAIIYFPLVILGLNRITEGKSAWIYSLFLGLSVASNFYIGWIACIFSVLYFIYLFISDDEVKVEKAASSDEESGEIEDSINIFNVFKNSFLLGSFFKFVASSLLAVGISAIMTLPSFYTLQSTGKGAITNRIFNFGFKDIFGLLASHIFPFEINYSTLTAYDCIFCFSGIVTVILCVAYFFSKKISMRKKLGNLFLILSIWISMLFYDVYNIWHGFGEPAGVMYRFAFVYSFVLLKIAYEAFCEIKNIPVYGIAAGTVFALVCVSSIYFSELFGFFVHSLRLAVILVAFIAVFTALIILISKSDKFKKAFTFSLLICVVVEALALNCKIIDTVEMRENFDESTVVKDFVSTVKDYDNVHFSSKKQTFGDMLMYGALFGYNGYEGYSSTSDGNFGLVMVDMGTYGNRLNQQNGSSEQTPVFNMFFPTEYYIDGTGHLSENQYREKISEKDGYIFYKNNYTMPFMYTVSTNILGWEPYVFPVHVDNINYAAQLLTDTSENIVFYNTNSNFTYENCEHISIIDRFEGNSADGHNHIEENREYLEYIESRMNGWSYKIEDMTKPAYIKYTSVAETNGIMYIYASSNELSDLKVTVNGVEHSYTVFGKDSKCTFEIGEVKKGDIAEISVGGYRENAVQGEDVYALEQGSVTLTAFTVDMDKFESAYNKLDAMSDTEMLEFEDTYVKAKVTSYEDGMLYIPTAYDEGWTITIDGEEVPLYEHESHILMTEISKGEHIVEMKYVPQGFIPGAVITGVSVLILIAWAVISTKRFKKEQESDIIVSNDVNEE